MALAAATASACGSGDSESAKDGGGNGGAEGEGSREREEKVLGSSTKKGEFPATFARATIEKPAAIKVRVTPTPAAKTTVSWNVACRRGTRAGNESGRYNVREASTRRLRAPLRRADVCEVSASVQMFKRGTVKVQVIG
jgi:hypothetical protein